MFPRSKRLLGVDPEALAEVILFLTSASAVDGAALPVVGLS